MQRECVLPIAGRGRLTSFYVEYKTASRVARQLGRSDYVARSCWDSGSERCHLHEDQAQDTLDRPVNEKKGTPTTNCFIGRYPSTDASVWSGATHEETGLERNGTRSSLAMNPDSISVVMTIVFVCRDPPGERLNPAFALQQHTAQTAGVIVWGAIAYNKRAPLVLIRGTMTTPRHVHDILQQHVLSLMQWLSGAIFQQDNALPHTARVSQDCLHTVTNLSWPSQSPDLSPIEHIWDHLGRRAGHPTNLIELYARLHQIWNEMSRDIIQNLYASMPDRIASCIRARRGSTGY
ncbi:transposable element Tcb2 transposase [Trichonephila clavipes]|nr:transposable element Tcb2 transposase [Trichonephila clavipes]